MLNPLTHRKVLKKGMPGTATIVEMGALDRGGTSFNLPMTLQVYVEGITPYEVEDQWMVKAKDTAGLSGSIPVRVDPKDHQKVAIDWDGVRAQYEQEKDARQQALAAQGPVTDPAQAMGSFGGAPDQAVTPSIDMRNDPELRAKIEQVLGRKLTPGTSETVAANDPEMQMRILQVVQEHAAQKSMGAAPATGFGDGAGVGDDTVAQLERLAALKDSGALTEKEFEREKRKLLGN
jgi:Short C-terminal domain